MTGPAGRGDGLRALAEGASLDSLRDGSWLVAVLRETVDDYVSVVTYQTLVAAHPGLSGDALADARIADAQWRATVAGGATAGAYASVVMAGLATGLFIGAAIPAAVTAFAVDLFAQTRLQICLAWDLSLIYAHPLDPADDDDLWTLSRVAFGVDARSPSSHVARPTAPLASRFGTRALTTGARLATGVQAVGKTLALRSVAKFAIPAVGVPLCAGVNHITTGAVGRAAREIFRDRAAGRSLARELAEAHELVTCAVLHLLHADARLERAEVALIGELAALSEQDLLGSHRARLTHDHPTLLARLRGASAELRQAAYTAALAAAELDGAVQPEEEVLLAELADACGVDR